MVGKCKLIGGIAGAAAASYGGYEAYSYFKPTVATASNLEDEPTVESVESELNRDLLNGEEITEEKSIPDPSNQEAQPEEVRGDNVADQPEVPQPEAEEQLDPQVPVIQAPVEFNTPAQLPPQKPKLDISRQSSNSYMRWRHLNSDGTIKIAPGSLVDRMFRDDVIVANKDDKVWEDKIRSWKYDLDYHEQLKKDRKGYRNPVPDEFTPKRGQKKDAETLQRMCASSYRKNSWNELNGRHNVYNKELKMRQYWTLVWKYCGKPSKQTPDHWFKG